MTGADLVSEKTLLAGWSRTKRMCFGFAADSTEFMVKVQEINMYRNPVRAVVIAWP